MSYLRINTPSVVHEIIDGEAVIVNLDNGLYFSTDGVGASLWALLAKAESIDAIHQWSAESFTADDVATDVSAFLSDLEKHQLVTAVADRPADDEAVDRPTGPATYGKPLLHTFSDMEELLLLDPVHDVGEQGWPKTN